MNFASSGREHAACRVTLYSDAIYFGGAEEYLVSLVRGLDREKFKLQAIVLGDPGAGRLQSALESYGVEVQHLDPPGFAWRSRLREMTAAFEKLPGDVLHVNLPSTYDAGVSSIAWAGKRAGYTRVVSTEHLPMIDRKYKKFPIKWVFSHYVDRILTPASSNEGFLTRLHGMRAKKIEVIPNGVGSPAPLSEDEVQRIRTEWGVEEGECLVGVVGRLTNRKGHHFLLEAAAPLIESGLPIRLVFIGDGEETDALKGQARDLGIYDRVAWAGLRPDAARMSHVFDLFALPSTVETMPLSILEAMACGCPVLSTIVYGIPDIVTDGETGVLVPPADVPRLREALSVLVGDVEMRRKMGRASRERYEAEFTAELMAERTGQVYLGTSEQMQRNA
jgi:glycosyltransferase involved in cell wall biosynthesis